MIDRLTAYLLGRHVAGRAKHRPGIRRGRDGGTCVVIDAGARRFLGQAEIENLQMAVTEDEQVFRLEIAVDDPAGVGGVQPARDLRGHRHGPRDRHGPAVQRLPQRLPLEQLRDGVVHAVVIAEIVNGEDVRMGERGDRTRLALESRDPFGIGRHGLRQNLDGHVAAQGRVVRAIHLAHATGAKRRDHFVRAEPGAGRERHAVGLGGW